MLPAAARLRRSADFTTTVRRGRRARCGPVLVHLLDRAAGDRPAADRPAGSRSGPEPGATCGFVVPKAVGGSVVRHRVQRRLRHLMAPRLATLPPGSWLVVRALPAAATASSRALGTALDHALRVVLRPAARPALPEPAPRS